MINHHIFWEVQVIIKNNKKLSQTPSHFFQWMCSVFALSAMVAVRRQRDNDKNSVSMLRILEELQKYPGLISRTHFKSLYGPGRAQGLAENEFDRFSGEGQPYLDQSMIQQDIDDLKKNCERIKHYVDKRIAHYDKNPPSPLPTFRDLEQSINFIDALVRKYYLILKASFRVPPLPTFPYDWKEIFRMPWILEEEREDSK